MASIIDYVKWRGDLTFEQSPFNEVDALILSEVIYADFKGLVPESYSQPVTMREVAFRFVNSFDFKKRKKSGTFINPLVVPLLQQLGESRRFGGLKLCGFLEKLDPVIQEQFAAMTILNENKWACIVYRGTDDNFVGFEEDANLGYKESIPSQLDALEYMKNTMSAFNCRFLTTGHSKGGNVAFFALRNIAPDLKKRVKTLYLFDSPGFAENFYEGREYKAIKSKVKLYVPELSIVGMIFKNPSDYTVVADDAVGIEQHDPFSWKCQGTGFEEVLDVRKESKFFYATMNSWYNELSALQRKVAIQTYNQILEETSAKTNTELAENKLDSIIKVLKTMKNLDVKTKKIFFSVLKLLLKYVNNNVFILTGRKKKGRKNGRNNNR